MNCYEVDALICLKDDLGIEYAVSEIEYKIWKNEEFEYRFRPKFSVIDLFQWHSPQAVHICIWSTPTRSP